MSYDINKTFVTCAAGLVAANILLPAAAGFGIITTGVTLYFMLLATNAIRQGEIKRD